MADAYRKAGVNIEAGYEIVDRIKEQVRRTFRPEVISGIGGFGGALDLSKMNLKEPVLVSGTDGVGTKLMVAFAAGRHDTVGIDCVAMCVNDIVTQGAEPLYFLDYLACGSLKPEKAEAIVKGIADGCEMAGCALVGGETAEMPGMYRGEDYDIAGFAVGAVEKTKRITGERIRPGDRLIGLSSNGMHSNGYSLVRKIIAEAGLSYTDAYEPNERLTIADELLKPTRIYVRPVLDLLKDVEVKGVAHITGGGFYENVPRMLPPGLGARIDMTAWPLLDVFRWLKKLGGLRADDMYHTFNMGIGMVLAVSPEWADQALERLRSLGETPYVIGRVTEKQGLTLVNGNEA
ncbi:phosphoribosylformylglycinamidine cyclo-ligase [Sporolactobacillus sp. THM7-7]|nr:phosphoribosylformylglycinamidine cyclo-ligase [Sporolactobacillus sp. THM7-7]